MKKLLLNSLKLVCLTLLFYSTVALSESQSYEELIQTPVDSIKSKEEVDQIIKKVHDNAYDRCIKQLACATDKLPEDIRIHFDHDRNMANDFLKNSTSKLRHDPHMPQHLYETARSLMLEKNIDPKNIEIEYHKFNWDHTHGDARSFVFVNGRPVGTPRIRIYRNIISDPEDSQEFTIAHELNHVLLQHSSMAYYLYAHNPHTNTAYLNSAIEKEADIHAASTNSKLACAGALDQCDRGHAHILDQKAHCKEMQFMCELMKRKEELS